MRISRKRDCRRTEHVEGGGPTVVEALLAQERCRRVREHRAEERASECGRHHPAAVRRRRPLVHQHVHRRQRRALRMQPKYCTTT